ncbi:MAG: excinuclease ABC subunit UvrC [Bacteroidales bacterium]|jgi:excinuclease ABC subunit C|nr:excinuclease ABC subunit UvrC [Bacteroidales bacterium]
MQETKPYDKISIKLETLPTKPGVYQFLDKNNSIIYVGKAKNLKSRVKSYFTHKNSHSDKTRVMVKHICDIKLVVVNNETEALLLEANMIKNLKPRYNILMRDDKKYPYLKITKEPFPRIEKVRTVQKDNGIYFGPFPKGSIIVEIMQIVRHLFKYRSCHLPLNVEDIKKGKYKACLDVQINLCDAPCIGNQSQKDYNDIFEKIQQILNGNFQQIINSMTEEMFQAVKELRFEDAHVLKEKIKVLENYKNKTAVVSNKIHNVEVYSYIEDEEKIYFNAMKVVNGCIISSYSAEVIGKAGESCEDIFRLAIIQTRNKFHFNSDKIVVPQKLDLPKEYVRQIIPKSSPVYSGEYVKLLELSYHNAMFEKSDRIKRATLVDPDRWNMKVVEQMQKDLHLPLLPKHIECFDNSNIQGNFPVASCVVFRNCKPSTAEYRHFNIKSVDGPDDFASMKEIIYRRYSRLQREEKPLPDLIVVDGGKGQLHAAVESLTNLGLMNKISIIGIAKRLEEIFYPDDPYPLCLDKRSTTLKVIQHIRDEAHRFGISFHRNKRSKATIRTQLTDIKGIGNNTAQKLLLKFASVQRIKTATLAELEECVGKSKAAIIFRHFNQQT